MNKYRLKIPRDALNRVIAQTKIPIYANTGQYILFHFRTAQTDFIIYDNTKDEPYRAIYEGPTLPTYLTTYLVSEKAREKKVDTPLTAFPQIGSDEVGFGDFFGPLVVVSAYVSKENRAILLNNGVQDSKKLSDERIIMLGESLHKTIPHTKNIVGNAKYNELVAAGYNMNKMKAMLHHNVLVKLSARMHYSGPLYYDKFTTEQKFNEYTKGMQAAPLVGVTDGETNSLAIATASVFARYYFLLEIHKLNKLYNIKIPLGAGIAVDDFAQKFMKEKGLSALKLITKHNFRNFKNLTAA